MFAFLAVAAIVIVVPGQDTALTIRNTLGGGRRAGIATACGVACGLATWAVATAFGLAAILVASEPLYLALKAFGAAYLLWLGACCLWRAIRQEAPATVAAASPRLSLRAAFRQGIVSNLGNAKIAVFFTSLLPQFTPADASFLTALALGLLFCLLTLAWLGGLRGDCRTRSERLRPATRPARARCRHRHRARRARAQAPRRRQQSLTAGA